MGGSDDGGDTTTGLPPSSGDGVGFSGTARLVRCQQVHFKCKRRVRIKAGSRPRLFSNFILTYQQVHSEKASRLEAVLARHGNVICRTSNASKGDIKVTVRQEWKHGKGNRTKVVRGTANGCTTITIKDRHNSLPFIVRNDHTIHSRFGGSKGVPKHTSIPVYITSDAIELRQGSLIRCCECPRRFVNFNCALARIVGWSRERL